MSFFAPNPLVAAYENLWWYQETVISNKAR